ncbi:MAG TPA: serine hydrolase domain-containing protein [Pseudonocardiaceae bacterium]|nr:serine hydrolase domain-containing protein [Pseudonocardiaceae bacterium]
MIDWTETSPQRAGVNPMGVAGVLELVHERGGIAQLCVLRRGKVVLDRAIGCQPDDLFWIFSASKPFVALLVHLLAERGKLALDDPVAEYWPKFGQRGKESITIRQVLRHRAGLPVARSRIRDALAMTNWDRSTRAIERAHPSRPAGDVPAYHWLSYGFILGEVVRRVTGTPVEEFLRTEFLDPLGLADTSLGLPADRWSRHVPIHGHGRAGRISQVYLNRRATRQAVIPAAGISTTARDLAQFYETLRRGGELDDVRVLAADTVEEARKPSSDGESDALLHKPIRWAQGFQLGSPGRPGAMGQYSSPETFGHNGSNCCIGWVDPGRQLVVTYLTDQLMAHGAAHLRAVSDAIINACR